MLIVNNNYCNMEATELSIAEKRKAQIQEYRKTHKEEIKQQTKIYNEKNKERIKERDKGRYIKYSQENKDKVKARNKLWQNNNADKVIIYKQNYKKNNKEKIRDRAQEILQTPDSYIKYLISKLKSKDTNKARENNIDFEYINELIELQGNKCVYSGVELVWKNKYGIEQGTIDRIDSVKGHIKDNCQLLTVPINRFKLDLPVAKFEELITLIKNNYHIKDNVNNNIILIKNMTASQRKKITTVFSNIKVRELERRQQTVDNELIDESDEDIAKELVVIRANGQKLTRDDIMLDFDWDFIDDLMNKQNGCCKLSNVPLTWKKKSLNMASIDRIDSSKGYSKDNIQLVLWYVNNLKNTLTNEETKKIIEQIITKNNN